MRAARLIRRTPETQAVPALREAARRDSNEFVRYRALVLLTAFNDRGTRDLMRELIRDRNDRVREVVYKWLERNPDPQLADGLGDVAADRGIGVRSPGTRRSSRGTRK
jgi:HEAT repeat protein